MNMHNLYLYEKTMMIILKLKVTYFVCATQQKHRRMTLKTPCSRSQAEIWPHILIVCWLRFTVANTNANANANVNSNDDSIIFVVEDFLPPPSPTPTDKVLCYGFYKQIGHGWKVLGIRPKLECRMSHQKVKNVSNERKDQILM